MAYKIAIGSSDKIHVDLKFGEVSKFLIYEVDSDIKLIEERIVEEGCAEKKSCSEGCSGHGGGCGGSEEVISRVSLIDDCRCVVCKKIGFQAVKQFEKKAISVFDVECLVEEALKKITDYYKRVG